MSGFHDGTALRKFTRYVAWFGPVLLLLLGCGFGEPKSQAELAETLLSKSYAAKYELGDVSEVKLLTESESGSTFEVFGSKQNGMLLTMGPLTPGSIPMCAIKLENGRQIPLFQEFLEESYKEDLESD